MNNINTPQDDTFFTPPLLFPNTQEHHMVGGGALVAKRPTKTHGKSTWKSLSSDESARRPRPPTALQVARCVMPSSNASASSDDGASPTAAKGTGHQQEQEHNIPSHNNNNNHQQHQHHQDGHQPHDEAPSHGHHSRYPHGSDSHHFANHQMVYDEHGHPIHPHQDHPAPLWRTIISSFLGSLSFLLKLSVVVFILAVVFSPAPAEATTTLEIKRDPRNARRLQSVTMMQPYSFPNGALDSVFNFTVSGTMREQATTTIQLDGKETTAQASKLFAAVDQEGNPWGIRGSHSFSLVLNKSSSVFRYSLHQQVAQRYNSQSEQKITRSGSVSDDPDCAVPTVSGKVCCQHGVSLYDVYTLIDSPVLPVTCSSPNPDPSIPDGGITPLVMQFDAAITASLDIHSRMGIPTITSTSSFKAAANATNVQRDTNNQSVPLELDSDDQQQDGATTVKPLFVSMDMDMAELNDMRTVLEDAFIFFKNSGVNMRICREGFDLSSTLDAISDPFFVPAWAFGHEQREIGYNSTKYVEDRASCEGQPLGEFTSRNTDNTDQFSFARGSDVDSSWGNKCKWINHLVSSVDAEGNTVLNEMALRCNDIGSTSGSIITIFDTTQTAGAFFPQFAMAGVSEVSTAHTNTKQPTILDMAFFNVDVSNYADFMSTSNTLEVYCEQCCIAEILLDGDTSVKSMKKCLAAAGSVKALATTAPRRTPESPLMGTTQHAFMQTTASLAIPPRQVRRFVFNMSLEQVLLQAGNDTTPSTTAPRTFNAFCRFAVRDSSVNSTGFATDTGRGGIFRSKVATATRMIRQAPAVVEPAMPRSKTALSPEQAAHYNRIIACPTDHHTTFSNPGERFLVSDISQCVPFEDAGCRRAYGEGYIWSAEGGHCIKKPLRTATLVPPPTHTATESASHHHTVSPSFASPSATKGTLTPSHEATPTYVTSTLEDPRTASESATATLRHTHSHTKSSSVSTTVHSPTLPVTPTLEKETDAPSGNTVGNTPAPSQQQAPSTAASTRNSTTLSNGAIATIVLLAISCVCFIALGLSYLVYPHEGVDTLLLDKMKELVEETFSKRLFKREKSRGKALEGDTASSLDDSNSVASTSHSSSNPSPRRSMKSRSRPSPIGPEDRPDLPWPCKEAAPPPMDAPTTVVDSALSSQRQLVPYVDSRSDENGLPPAMSTHNSYLPFGEPDYRRSTSPVHPIVPPINFGGVASKHNSAATNPATPQQPLPTTNNGSFPRATVSSTIRDQIDELNDSSVHQPQPRSLQPVVMRSQDPLQPPSLQREPSIQHQQHHHPERSRSASRSGQQPPVKHGNSPPPGKRYRKRSQARSTSVAAAQEAPQHQPHRRPPRARQHDNGLVQSTRSSVVPDDMQADLQHFNNGGGRSFSRGRHHSGHHSPLPPPENEDTQLPPDFE